MPSAPTPSPLDLHNTLLGMQSDGRTTVQVSTSDDGVQKMAIHREIPGLQIDALKVAASDGRLSQPDSVRITLTPHVAATRERLVSLLQGLQGVSHLDRDCSLAALRVTQLIRPRPSNVGYQLVFAEGDPAMVYTRTDETSGAFATPRLAGFLADLQAFLEEEPSGDIKLDQVAK